MMRRITRVRLPGLPWSPSFMAAYEAAMSGRRTSIGAGRIKPGSVAAVVAETAVRPLTQKETAQRGARQGRCPGRSERAWRRTRARAPRCRSTVLARA